MDFKLGDLISHYKFGNGICLGNKNKRGDKYYYHIKYDDDTFAYNCNLKLRENATPDTIEIAKSIINGFIN